MPHSIQPGVGGPILFCALESTGLGVLGRLWRGRLGYMMAGTGFTTGGQWKYTGQDCIDLQFWGAYPSLPGGTVREPECHLAASS